MNLALLPNLISLLVFFGAFRPLARRAGPRANDWFIAFAFVLVHEFALTFEPYGIPRIMELVANLSIELAALVFLRATVWEALDRASAAFLAIMIAPVFAQAALLETRWSVPWLHALLCLLMLAPLGYLWLLPGQKTPRRELIANAEALLSLFMAVVFVNHAATGLVVMHAALFAGAGIMCWRYADRFTSGVRTTVIGLLAWSLMFPVEEVLQKLSVETTVWLVLLRIPEFVVAYGVVLMLIERYVAATESLALHDPLTGLPNRRLFDDRLEQAIQTAPDSGTMLACLVIDVDRFKQINDTLGHLVGDGLLQAVATRLSWHVGLGDTLARTGGDEFSAVLSRLQSLEHLRFTVGAMMSATCVPVVVGEHSLNVGLSIGIAIYPQHGINGDDLRRNADDAMYDAKRSGGNRFAYVGGPPNEEAHLMLGVPTGEVNELVRR